MCEICFTPGFSVSTVNFEHVIAGWEDFLPPDVKMLTFKKILRMY